MLSRSTAYHVPVDVSPSRDEINIKNAIDRIHYEEPAFGVRRIRNELHKQGFHNVGRRLVRRYMMEMDIVCFYPGPNLSKGQSCKNLSLPAEKSGNWPTESGVVHWYYLYWNSKWICVFNRYHWLVFPLYCGIHHQQHPANRYGHPCYKKCRWKLWRTWDY